MSLDDLDFTNLDSWLHEDIESEQCLKRKRVEDHDENERQAKHFCAYSILEEVEDAAVEQNEHWQINEIEFKTAIRVINGEEMAEGQEEQVDSLEPLDSVAQSYEDQSVQINYQQNQATPMYYGESLEYPEYHNLPSSSVHNEGSFQHPGPVYHYAAPIAQYDNYDGYSRADLESYEPQMATEPVPTNVPYIRSDSSLDDTRPMYSGDYAVDIPSTSTESGIQHAPTAQSKLLKSESKIESKVSLEDSANFTNVTSQLALVGSRKVEVTMGEIRRRMGAPEFADRHMLQRLARIPKTSGISFVRKLVKHGIEPIEAASGHAHLIISGLTEGDANTLAKDFNKLTCELSKEVLGSIAADAVGGNAFKDHAEGVIQHLLRTKEYLKSAGLKTDAEQENCPDIAAVRNFSLETHGFGPQAVVMVIDLLLTVVAQMKSRFPSAASIKRDFAQLSQRPSFSKKASTPACDIDPCLLSALPDDEAPYDNAVLPRIAYDCTVSVSIGEIRRRILGPERFNCSLICAYLRKAKNAKTVPLQHEALKKIGINLDKNTKKSVHPNSWTALTEREAIAMAKETGWFLSHLPASQQMTEAASFSPDSASLLRQVAGSIGAALVRIGETPEQRCVETEADLHVLRFAMISHHFGHNFIAAVMHWLEKVVC